MAIHSQMAVFTSSLLRIMLQWTGEQMSLRPHFQFFWTEYIQNIIARSYSSSIFNILWNLRIVFHSSCTIVHFHQQWARILTSSHPCQHLLFIYPFILDNGHPNRWGDISLWFRFAFPWWLVISNIFFYTCWPFVCLLWRNVYSSPLPIFKSGRLFFCGWAVRVLYIFCLLDFYQMYDWQIFSPIPWVAFSLCWSCALVRRRF